MKSKRFFSVNNGGFDNFFWPFSSSTLITFCATERVRATNSSSVRSFESYGRAQEIANIGQMRRRKTRRGEQGNKKVRADEETKKSCLFTTLLRNKKFWLLFPSRYTTATSSIYPISRCPELRKVSLLADNSSS